jgi:hypothetical protein
MPKRIDVPGIGLVEFPDEMTDDQIVTAIKANTPKQPSPDDERRDMLRREVMTFLSPARGVKDLIDTGAQGLARMIGGKEEGARIEAMNKAGKDKFDADTKGSMVAPFGRFVGQMAGVAPAIGGLGAGVGVIAPRIGQAIAAGGFAKNVPLPINIAGGAAGGMAGAAMVNPESDSVALGGALGAGLPLLGRPLSSATDWASKVLMQSAIKPTIKQLKSGDAAVAIDTMLEQGVSPTKAGVSKLRGLVDAKNAEISGAIQGSSATIDKLSSLGPLSETARKFSKQVNPTSDLNAISNAGMDFLNHPLYQGTRIPVQDAQELKQGTYKILSKKYGQVGTADTEAQKAIARGLKDKIAEAVPEIKGLNADEAKLLRTLNVAERRALMELNKNPAGLSWLANSPATWLAFMADRSAAFKALAARMMYSTNKGAGQVAPATGRAMGLLGAEYADPNNLR